MLSIVHTKGHDDPILTTFSNVTPLRDASSQFPGFSALFDKVPRYYHEGRIGLTFFIADDFSTDFGLIRGLMEFNRPRTLQFRYDRRQRSVDVEIDRGQLEELQRFLAHVLALLGREKQFRHALKLAIEFEDRYRVEREGVYAVLRNQMRSSGETGSWRLPARTHLSK